MESILNGTVGLMGNSPNKTLLNIHKFKDEIFFKEVHASFVTTQKQVTERPRTYYSKSRPALNTAIAIGTSTGGPRALQRVLADIRDNVSPPIFIVQHMPAGFIKSLAKRLDRITNIHVKEAINEDVVQQNTAYIAPGNFHMEVYKESESLVINLTEGSLINGHRPAVDKLFHSIANLQGTKKIAIVLTGMGKDGSKGIKQIKKNDPTAITIAEAEESAIIFGMPAAAIETTCIDQITPLHKLGEVITNLLN